MRPHHARIALPLIALTLTGCTAIPVPTIDTPAPAPAPLAALPPEHTGMGHTVILATDALDTLEVKGRAPMTGYDRDRFGDGWGDADGDGCDTRAEILRRDAVPGTAVFNDDGCVIGADVDDPYTGTRLTEAPGPDSELDIEHLVALGDAWAKGAQQLTADERDQLANDPLGLIAADDDLNRQHADGDAATWLPPRTEYRCEYIARQIAVKAAWRLWVTAAERDAMARVLESCPGQPLPTRPETAA